MSIAIEVDIRGFHQVQRVLHKLSHLQLHDLLDNVGNMIANQTGNRILHERKAPDGTAWKKLGHSPGSKRYQKYKSRVKPGVDLLQFHGDLRDTLTHNVSGKTLEVGSGEDHAATHQLGSRDGSTPARPYLGLSQENADDVEDMINVWIRKRVGV